MIRSCVVISIITVALSSPVPGSRALYHVQFILDFRRLENAFGANHLLNLKQQRLSILEDQRDQGTDLDPASFFEGNDVPSKRRALSLVVRMGEEIGLRQWVHEGRLYASRTI